MLFASVVIICACCTSASAEPKPNRLLLVSMDGFRWDRLSQAEAPNIWRLTSEGSYSRRMMGVFPTLTFPSHWSIVTGNTPEKHGVVSNSFYDPSLRSVFRSSSREEVWWNATEPIWVTAMKHNLSAATYFWPGSEVEIRGYRPKFWLNYTANVSKHEQIDTVIEWLLKQNVDVAIMYFDEPDATAHLFGPDSPEYLQKIKEVDELVGYLLRRMNENDLTSSTNLILLSDHGMTTLSQSRVVDVSQWINISQLEWFLPGPILQLIPKSGHEAKIYDALKNAHPNFKVFLRSEIPLKFKYSDSQRIAPIVAIADEGWLISLENVSLTNRGGHGYDNALSSMKPFVVVRGPDFNAGSSVDEISLLDIYPLMCRLLGVTPQLHDGNICNVRSFLRDSVSECAAWALSSSAVRHFSTVQTSWLATLTLLFVTLDANSNLCA